MDKMTAGSYMYIGPQGIVHGTTIMYGFECLEKLKNRQRWAFL